MNRFLNFLSNILILGFASISFLVHNKDFGTEIPMFREFTVFFPLIILLIFLFKSYSRWGKLKLVKKKDGYNISQIGWKKAFTYEVLPFFIFIPLSFILLLFVEDTTFFIITLYLLVFEGLFFMKIGKKTFKMVLTDQALIILNNNQHFIFWAKIKMISFQQKGMVILLKNKRQIYVGESDFENFLIWKKKNCKRVDI
jgi:hypothetical protein